MNADLLNLVRQQLRQDAEFSNQLATIICEHPTLVNAVNTQVTTLLNSETAHKTVIDSVLPQVQARIQTQIQTQVQAQVQSAVATSVNAMNTNGLNNARSKFAKPEKFDGSMSACRGFLNQVTLYLNAHPKLYTNDREKVQFTLSLLKGDALDYASIVLVDPNHEYYLSFKDFSDFLKTAFDDPDRIRTAERKLYQLKQTGSCVQYGAAFTKLALDVEWDEKSKMSHFERGLKDGIKDSLAQMITRPKSFQELFKVAIQIDNALHARQMEKSFKRSYPITPPSSYSVPNSSVASSVNSGPTPMQVDSLKLDPAQMERCKKLGLCFKCNERGHRARDCPKDGNGSNTTVVNVA